MKPGSWLESVNCAIDGILWAVKSQRHLRYHFLAALVVLCLSLFFRISALEFFLLVLAALLVIFAELVNTAIETLVDLVTDEYHILAKRAKDVAAGAVLVTSFGSAVLGYLVLSGHIFPLFGSEPTLVEQPVGNLPLAALLIVTILVVLLKAKFVHGTSLHGGMPSGHTAISFSIATSVVLSDVGLLVSGLVLMLAVMVSHSRLLLGIHNWREVIMGAVLGSGVTFLLIFFFG